MNLERFIGNMFRLVDVCKQFSGKVVLRSLSFSFAAGSIVGLIGPSGAGKSVLLKVLGNIIEPDSGEFYFPGEDTVKTHSVGFLFQESALFDSMTVLENVAFPLLVSGNKQNSSKMLSYKDAMHKAYNILVEVGLSNAYNKLPGQLSGGMRRRVGIARALVASPDLVLLDDPTGGLDPVAASVIMNLINKLYRRYKPTIVICSHDLRRLFPNVQQVIALKNGRIWCNEQVSELAKCPQQDLLKFVSARYDIPNPTSV